MRVHSDKLTYRDFVEALPAGVYLDTVESIGKPRLRRYGWAIKLRCPASGRWRNSGTYGAATDQMPDAASWDQTGCWISELFERDPDARIEQYDGYAAFHRQTANKYMGAGVPSS